MSGTTDAAPIASCAERTFALIRVDSIDVVNSRGRGKKQFNSNVRSIADNGLYKPILVNAIEYAKTGRYQLICGEGRLLAHRELKRETIKAEIVNVPLATAHIMSLGENMTKSAPQAVEYAYALQEMHRQGTSLEELSRITGHPTHYVRSYLTLVERGEERLIRGLERGLFPLEFAMKVAVSPDAAIQHILIDAYDQKFITARHVDMVRKLLTERMKKGGETSRRGSRETVTAETLRRDISNLTREKERWVKEVEGRETRLIRLMGLIQGVLEDEALLGLLRKHGLDQMPTLQGSYGS